MKIRAESYVPPLILAGVAVALVGLAHMVQLVDDSHDVEPDEVM